MSYTETPNLKLKKDDGNEKIANWRPHSNGNMDILDEAVQNLVEVCANAKSLLGQLGLDESGNPLVNAASARNTLGAATSGGASKSLYAAEQSIATNASNISKNTTNISKNTTNISKNATDIQTLRDSVSQKLSIGAMSNAMLGTYDDNLYLDAYSQNGNKYTVVVNFSALKISLFRNDRGLKEWT